MMEEEWQEPLLEKYLGMRVKDRHVIQGFIDHGREFRQCSKCNGKGLQSFKLGSVMKYTFYSPLWLLHGECLVGTGVEIRRQIRWLC